MAPSNNIVDPLTTELLNGDNVTVVPDPNNKDVALIQIAVNKDFANAYLAQQQGEKTTKFHLVDFMKTHRQKLISFEEYRRHMKEDFNSSVTHELSLYRNFILEGYFDKTTGNLHMIWGDTDDNFYISEIPISQIIELQNQSFHAGPGANQLEVEIFMCSLLKEIGLEGGMSFSPRSHEKFEREVRDVNAFLQRIKRDEGIKRL